MRAIALIALLIGCSVQLLLDGQVFTHAIIGVVCGLIALVCVLASARKDRTHRWEGLVMAGPGIALGLTCAITLPWTWRQQKNFNGRMEQIRRLKNLQHP